MTPTTFRTAVRSRIADPRALAILVAALVGGLASAQVARADAPVHQDLRGFYRTGRYILFVSHQEVTGVHIYHSPPSAALLILDSAYGSPVLIQPRTGGVDAVPPDALVVRGDQGIDIVADVRLIPLGKFAREGSDVVIRVPRLVARLRPKGALLGRASAQQLVEHTPEYDRAASLYEPDASAIQRLSQTKGPVSVTVYFGSWCPTCTRLVPRILRLERELIGSSIRFAYYGLPQPPEMWSDPEVVRVGVRKLPTGVVIVGERTAGTLASTDWNHPESALLDLIARGG